LGDVPANRTPPAPRIAVAEIFITPLGTGESTIREYIRALVPLVEASGLAYQLTAMGTLVEGPVDEVLALAARLHAATFDVHAGTDRVITHLRLDERRGEPLSLDGKVRGALGLRPDQAPLPPPRPAR
jgi:uncharacterized protein (TIGR00106 family)